MAELGSIIEVFELAISREVDAYEFYMALVGRVGDLQTRAIFEELAREELEHKAKLELEVMKQGGIIKTEKKIKGFDSKGYIADTDGQINMSYKDLLGLAIQKERVSFRFYVDLSAMINDLETKEILISIAEEEARHMVRFENEYDKIISRGK